MTVTIPSAIHRQLTQPDSIEAAAAAMTLFLAHGDRHAFQDAVAIYCTAARERTEEVETVIATLCCVGADLEGPNSRDQELLLRPSEMHQLILGGILRAFYGDAAVDRAAGASAQRKADAPQHAKGGTWPRRLSD